MISFLFFKKNISDIKNIKVDDDGGYLTDRVLYVCTCFLWRISYLSLSYLYILIIHTSGGLLPTSSPSSQKEKDATLCIYE